jgi:hypothetical protein
MFRFTIRDVLWLTVVVALAVGWFVNRNQFLLNRKQLLRQMEQAERQRDEHKAQSIMLKNTLDAYVRLWAEAKSKATGQQP